MSKKPNKLADPNIPYADLPPKDQERYMRIIEGNDNDTTEFFYETGDGVPTTKSTLKQFSVLFKPKPDGPMKEGTAKKFKVDISTFGKSQAKMKPMMKTTDEPLPDQPGVSDDLPGEDLLYTQFVNEVSDIGIPRTSADVGRLGEIKERIETLPRGSDWNRLNQMIDAFLKHGVKTTTETGPEIEVVKNKELAQEVATFDGQEESKVQEIFDQETSDKEEGVPITNQPVPILSSDPPVATTPELIPSDSSNEFFSAKKIKNDSSDAESAAGSVVAGSVAGSMFDNASATGSVYPGSMFDEASSYARAGVNIAAAATVPSDPSLPGSVGELFGSEGGDQASPTTTENNVVDAPKTMVVFDVKYHKAAVNEFFGSWENPDWDPMLSKSIMGNYENGFYTKECLLKLMKQMISNQSTKVCDLETNEDSKMEDVLTEYAIISQIHFCVLRNLARGPRTKQALVPLKSLIDLHNMVSGTGTAPPIDPMDETIDTTGMQPTPSQPAPPLEQNAQNIIKKDITIEKISETFRNRPYTRDGPLRTPLNYQMIKSFRTATNGVLVGPTNKLDLKGEYNPYKVSANDWRKHIRS